MVPHRVWVRPEATLELLRGPLALPVEMWSPVRCNTPTTLPSEPYTLLANSTASHCSPLDDRVQPSAAELFGSGFDAGGTSSHSRMEVGHLKHPPTFRGPSSSQAWCHTGSLGAIPGRAEATLELLRGLLAALLYQWKGWSSVRLWIPWYTPESPATQIPPRSLRREPTCQSLISPHSVHHRNYNGGFQLSYSLHSRLSSNDAGEGSRVGLKGDGDIRFPRCLGRHVLREALTEKTIVDLYTKTEKGLGEGIVGSVPSQQWQINVEWTIADFFHPGKEWYDGLVNT